MDRKLLKMKCVESDMTFADLSRAVKMPYNTLYRRLNGDCDWKVSEIVKVVKALKLSSKDVERIFFLGNNDA